MSGACLRLMRCEVPPKRPRKLETAGLEYNDDHVLAYDGKTEPRLGRRAEDAASGGKAFRDSLSDKSKTHLPTGKTCYHPMTHFMRF